MDFLVITRHAPANYGSLLQTIATQKVLERLGHSCRILDYVRSDETGSRVAFTQLQSKPQWNKNVVKKCAYLAARQPENLMMYYKFQKMRERFLKLSKRYSSISALKSDIPSADVYMTGSDQVWGPISNGDYDPAYFFNFLPDSSKIVSYASSFGKSVFNSQVLAEYKRHLQRYESILVRENSALDLLSEMGLSGEQVLDPTLLLSADEWSAFIEEKDESKEQYVLVYQIHNNPKLDRYASEFSQKAGLPLYRVSPLLHQISRSGKFIYLPDISKFLALIKSAKYLITDSFHGTVFSMIFNTQFVEILPHTGTKSRNQSLLQLVELNDRIVTKMDDLSYVDRRIRYSNVNEILEGEKAKSLNMLNSLLKD